MSRYSFFTGKGGVGKTTLSCATAVKWVNSGKTVLLVCTDPASNLSDVLGMRVGSEITEHPDLNGLFTINLDPKASTEDYKSRLLTGIRKEGSDQEVKDLEKALHGACTTEIASFDHFAKFISGEIDDSKYDRIIFDTAPTGHTLRLLELPGAWETYLEQNPRGGASIRPNTNMDENKQRYKKVVETLNDSSLTLFNLVARSDASSLLEASRTSKQLGNMGFENQRLLINGVFHASNDHDPVAKKLDENAQNALKDLPDNLKKMDQKQVALLPYNVLGIQKLTSVFDSTIRDQILKEEINKDLNPSDALSYLPISNLTDNLINESTHGLIMPMGKGGVGKTLVASKVALDLAKKGFPVLLSTTDPASHIHFFLNQLDELPPNLEIERIDPNVETEKYRKATYESKSEGLSENEKQDLWADLQTPCNQEISVFIAFSKMLRKAKRKFVVMDTAPTGHTLMLLDTTGNYHREIIDSTKLDISRLITPYMELQNPDFAKIILVALPETTPINEGLSLQESLISVGIEPSAWVINQSVQDLKVSDVVLTYKDVVERKLVTDLQNQNDFPFYNISLQTNKKFFPDL